jgi:hypothetical protein
MDPELRRSRVELGSDAERDDDYQKLQKRATKRLDRMRDENDRPVLLDAAQHLGAQPHLTG